MLFLKQMKNTQLKWIFLCVLSLIWGSSFILIKKALVGLTPMQLGALRTLFAAIFLIMFSFPKLKGIRKREWKWISISAFLGTFIPAFLFAFAETEIDSAIASILNSTTPIMTLLLGAIVFGVVSSRQQALGVVVGLIGSCLLVWAGSEINPDQNYWYAGLVLIASVCYALNVNIVKKHLQQLSAVAISVGTFAVLVIPATLVLIYSGFFTAEIIQSEVVHTSLLYLVILSIFGTAIAKILFNKLIQASSPVFASSVTYTMPIVAVVWGLLDGETFRFLQIVAAFVILTGVYLANKRRN